MDMLVNQAREALLQRRRSLSALLGGVLGAGVQEPRSERDVQELRDIEDALARIHEGRFGHCARCGGAIGRHRLLAIPEARLCMACSAHAHVAR